MLLKMLKLQVAVFVCETPKVPFAGSVAVHISFGGGRQWIRANQDLFFFDGASAPSVAPSPSPVVAYSPLQAEFSPSSDLCILSTVFSARNASAEAAAVTVFITEVSDTDLFRGMQAKEVRQDPVGALCADTASNG